MAEYEYIGYEWAGIARDGSHRNGCWIITAAELATMVQHLFDEGWTLLNVRDPAGIPVATIGPGGNDLPGLTWWVSESGGEGNSWVAAIKASGNEGS